MNLRSSRAFVGSVMILSIAFGCAREKPASTSDESQAAPDSMGVAPRNVSVVAMRTKRNLRESSALATSVAQPDVLFTINDSGNDATLFALDTTGADRGAWKVKDATNVDWEALASGPCGTPVGAHCIYIGDVGDNTGHHPTRTLYRVAEPPARDASFNGTLSAERVTFTYADHPRDVEAMYVARNGDAFLITKGPLLEAATPLRPALIFRVAASAWTSKTPVVAELVDSLSIVPGSAPLRAITDASLSGDDSYLAVRTYSQLFVYKIDATTGRPVPRIKAAICNLVSLGEAQGEGVTWIGTDGRFGFSSEGATSPLHFADCPLPK